MFQFKTQYIPYHQIDESMTKTSKEGWEIEKIIEEDLSLLVIWKRHMQKQLLKDRVLQILSKIFYKANK